MKQRKQKQSRRLLFRLFLLICIVVGLLIALYPFYVDSLNSLMDQKRMEQVQKRTAAENEAQRKKMEEQNQRLTDQGFNPGADPFDEQNRNESTTSSQLEEWLIGSVNIPKIQINISLYDRLNGMILEKWSRRLTRNFFPTWWKFDAFSDFCSQRVTQSTIIYRVRSFRTRRYVYFDCFWGEIGLSS